LLALAFSAGMIAVFVVLGLLTLVLGVIGWSELIAKDWFAWTIVTVLVVLAAGMFGGFAVNLPSGVYQWAPRHDTYFGNVQFGVLAALLSTPCTAPLLPAVMAWAATQPVALRIVVMTVVGVGMASPYVLLSAFPEAARKFPRTGPWSELVKQMMGFLLLGSAVFFAAGRLVPSAKFWWWLLPVAVAASLYLVVRTIQLSGRPRALVVAFSLAVLMTGTTAVTAAYMNGLLDRSRSGADGGMAGAAGWDPLATARAGGNVVLVKFTANWCLNCQTIDARVYHDVAAAAALKDHAVIPMKADLTEEDAVGWPTLKREEPSGGIPVTAIYVPGYEQPIKLTQIYGVDKLKQILDEVAKLPGRPAAAAMSSR
jgi:thiol:disulfide interchange protein DsbD